MSTTDYIDQIEQGFQRHVDITDYRINLGAGQGISVGIRDNDVGSVYSPMSFADTIGGGFLIQWRDGRLSRSNLDGNSLLQLDTVLQRAQAAAYDDPDAAQFLGPQDVREIPLSSPDVAPLFAERAGYLLEVVRLLEGVAERHAARTLNGGSGASMSESWLRTSQGLRLTSRGTSFSYSASFDGIIGDGFRRRTVVDEAEIEEQVERVGVFLDQLRKEVAVPPPADDMVIVLHPNVAYSMFDFFVWGNMGGGAVFHEQSAWSKADFLEQRQVFRPDLHVRVEPWEPLGPGSFGWTGRAYRHSQPPTSTAGAWSIRPST